MVTRIWHGKTKKEDADHYLEFLIGKGTKEYLQTPGNLSVKVWRRLDQDCCHFYTVSEWVDLNSIEEFAGKEINMAKYYPEDENFLLEFEETVMHLETFNVK